MSPIEFVLGLYVCLLWFLPAFKHTDIVNDICHWYYLCYRYWATSNGSTNIHHPFKQCIVRKYSVMLLMKYTDCNQSYYWNWVFWQIKDPFPWSWWDGPWCRTGTDRFHKICKNVDGINKYLITFLDLKWNFNSYARRKSKEWYFSILFSFFVVEWTMLFERVHCQASTQRLKCCGKQTWINIIMTNINNKIGVFTPSNLTFVNNLYLSYPIIVNSNWSVSQEWWWIFGRMLLRYVCLRYGVTGLDMISQWLLHVLPRTVHRATLTQGKQPTVQM